MKKIHVTVWNEFRHEKTKEHVKSLYPDGMHAVIADAIGSEDIEVTLATLDDPCQGLSDEVLQNTDVLIWWGHKCHNEVDDALVEKIRQRVFMGMGLICLHSAHHSKIFRAVIGTTGNLTWGDNKKEVLWNINPTHPIAKGIPSHFKLEAEEIYAEPFQIPDPDETLFLGWYETGYVFRSGCCWRRGAGKIFYFQPGHESVPTFYNEYVRQIIKNAVYWAAPAETGYKVSADCPYLGGNFVPDEELHDFQK